MLRYIPIFGRQVPGYGLMMALAVVAAVLVCLYRTRKQKLAFEDGILILTCAFGCALLGAGALYLFVTYSISEIIAMIADLSLFTQPKMGLVFYGGLIGAIPGVFIGAKIAGVKLGDYINALLPVVPLGHALGRIGCFLGGCCYGAPTDSWVGVVYPEGIIHGIEHGTKLLPVQLFEAGALLVFFVIMCLPAVRKLSALKNVALYVFLYAPTRFILECFRFDAYRGFAGSVSTSQWISVILMIVAGFVLILFDRPQAAPAAVQAEAAPVADEAAEAPAADAQEATEA